MKNCFLIMIFLILSVSCKKTNISSCCDGNPQVATIDSCVIAMPDIFTPNGDGINDMLFVLHRNIATIHLTVSKKFGKKVFETTDIATGWDGNIEGKEAREKEFSYTLDATTINGASLSLSGSVCIIRDNCAKGPVENCFFQSQFTGYAFDPTLLGESIENCE